MKKDDTIINGINGMLDSNESLNNFNKRKNCKSEYIEPAMMKQNSIDNLYRNNLLRSKTLPIKNDENIKKNLIKEYEHEIKMEENFEKKEKKSWLNGRPNFQMINKNNNIQTNIESNQELRGTSLHVPEYHVRHHSLSLPTSKEKIDLTEKKDIEEKVHFHKTENTAKIIKIVSFHNLFNNMNDH
ncbi:hypothetical protein PIROE2DRAFT_6046 [Piromyces sp. E2]|nr:hypothetical protein PIROE2DRAFT_6046 [Piromyces sp. E2]|eukprot:OUM66630.1 hypothetical protein PIROE2DRAFT_6046 [Piromyces sp. E2]